MSNRKLASKPSIIDRNVSSAPRLITQDRRHRATAEPSADRFTTAVFFPGLGSRAAYRDVGVNSIQSDFDSVQRVYDEAAEALDLSGASGLELTASNIPSDPVERQGFIGAALLVHNLAIHRDVDERAARAGDIRTLAYTGESFGILAAAVASGSLSVHDGALLARAFTPLLLAASSQRAGGEFGRAIEKYLPQYASGTAPIAQPSHVIALKAQPEELADVVAHLTQRHGDAVEVHKRYSPYQVNVYVEASFISTFVRLLRGYPAVTVEELKAPTRFLAHSRRMIAAREALDRFIDAESIQFADPHTPVISNSGGSFLLAADQVRQAVLAMTDEVMDSQRTAELINELRPDLVAEVGLGGKSLQLLRDNAISSEVMGVANAKDAARLVRNAAAARQLKQTGRELRGQHGSEPGPDAMSVLRKLTGLAAREPVFDGYLRRAVCAMVREAERNPHHDASSAVRIFRETLQYTIAYRNQIRPRELVLNARLRRHLVGTREQRGQTYTELRVLSQKGTLSYRETVSDEDSEALVVHFERPRRPQLRQSTLAARRMLDSQPAAQRIHDAIVSHLLQQDADAHTPAGLEVVVAHTDAVDTIVHQAALFEMLKQHRPGLIGQSPVFLEGSDPLGWLIALVAGGAASPADVVDLAAQILLDRVGGSTHSLVSELSAKLRDAEVPLLALRGTPVRARKDLQAETAAIFGHRNPRRTPRLVRLSASCTVVALGHANQLARLDTGGYPRRDLVVRRPEELQHPGLNPDLDATESRVLLTSSQERRIIASFARKRNLLPSTVAAYVNAGESVIGFGEGGSESMTIFFRREGTDDLLVRKVLSEALTTARWDPHGTGPMLPPFTKAKRQAEYLRALPPHLRPYFPSASNMTERRIQVKDHDGHESDRNEVIYEMSFVRGVEVGQYVRDYAPSPRIVAHLYKLIAAFLHEKVHSHDRAPAPGDTLEEQYFRKIEDRLDLSRRTAPRTFNTAFLDSETITINGRRYRNYRRLLAEFRSHRDFLDVLEPRFHALVVGDTNTENIKIGNLAPLVRAQDALNSHANAAEIERTIGEITAETIELKFLDPRAIGYRSEGASTRDDPMYDNKPWHNSIGHYDELHNELFDLDVSTGRDGTPQVTITFHPDNPYQRAYAVRDLTERRKTVNPDAPIGVEDHFAAVMSSVYRLDSPASLQYRDDPHWITRFVFIMGTHFTAMPPFHFKSEIEGTIVDAPEVQRRPIAIYCEGIKWLNWALEMLEGTRPDFLGIPVPPAVTIHADDSHPVPVEVIM